jgi:hypothetical protein
MAVPKTKEASIIVAKYIVNRVSSKSFIPYDNFIDNYYIIRLFNIE